MTKPFSHTFLLKWPEKFEIKGNLVTMISKGTGRKRNEYDENLKGIEENRNQCGLTGTV